MGGLALVLGLAAGICFDLGFMGTAWACGTLALTCFLMAAPMAEMLDCE